MNETLIRAIALVAGVILGAFFFGGLWWTVRRGLNAKRPVVWFLGSLMVRTLGVLWGFYWVADGQWQRLVFCLVGFALARPIVNRVTQNLEAKTLLEHENPHAS